MTIITFPDTLGMMKQGWGRRRTEITSESAFGGSQSAELGHPRWKMSLTPPPYLDYEFGEFKALLLSLDGRTNLLACHDLRRPVPIGSMRGSMTAYADVGAGARTMQIIAAGEAGKTLLRGDGIGIGSGMTQQIIVLTADATSDESGLITINFASPLRNSFTAGSDLT